MEPIKHVVFRRNGVLYLTTLSNFESIIPDANALTRLEGFKTYEEVTDYFWKWKQIPKDYIIDKTCKEDW